MKKIDLGQTVQIIANAGVIAGLIVLIVELNQNNEVLTLQARTALQASKTAEQMQVIGNVGGITEVVAKANRGEALNDVERIQLGVSRNFSLYNYAFIYREVANGLLEETDIPIRQWASVLQSPWMRDYWQEAKKDFPSDFVQFIDERVLTHEN